MRENNITWDTIELDEEAIRTAVTELHMPFLGFCLGHQLLADARRLFDNFLTVVKQAAATNTNPQ